MAPELSTIWLVIGLLGIFLIRGTNAVNIALNKPASQTGVWGGMTADRAVDGQYDRDEEDYYQDVCAHPGGTNPSIPAQWWVDLGGEFIVDAIEIWNTYNKGGYDRMSNFTVSVETPGVRDVTCGTQDADPVGRGQSALYTCPVNTFGSRVYVRKMGQGDEPQFITICEVDVQGVNDDLHHHTKERIHVIDIRARSVVLEWEQVTLDNLDPGLYGYQIQHWMIESQIQHWTIERDQNVVTLNVTYDTSLTTVRRTLSDLSPGRHYKVTLTPYTRRDGGQIQMGTSYPEQDVTTLCGAPGTTENVGWNVKRIPGQDLEVIDVTYQLPLEVGCDSITAVWALHGLIGSGSSERTMAAWPGAKITITVSTPGTYSLGLHVLNNGDFESKVGPWDVTISMVNNITDVTTTVFTSEATSGEGHVAKVPDSVVTIGVSVAVILGVIVAAIVVTFLVLRHRRQMAAQAGRSSSTDNKAFDSTNTTPRGREPPNPPPYEDVENSQDADTNHVYANQPGPLQYENVSFDPDLISSNTAPAYEILANRSCGID